MKRRTGRPADAGARGPWGSAEEREQHVRQLVATMEGEDPIAAAWATVDHARLEFEAGAYDRALQGVDGALVLFAALAEAEGEGELLLVRGSVRLEQAAYAEAAEDFTRARELFDETLRTDLVARARHNLGLVFWRLRDYGAAREEISAAAEVFGACADARGTGNCYNSLGLIAEDEGDLPAALGWYAEAIPLLRRVGADAFVANALANTGSVYERQGHLGLALNFHERALAERVRVGHRRGVVGSRVEIARVSLALGDRARAEREVAAARPEAVALGLRKHLAELDGLDARLAAARGDFEAAWHAEVAAGGARAELASAETTRRVAEIQARAKVEAARREAQRRVRENDALRAAHEAAAAADRAKGTVISTLRQAIRGPLTRVVGAGELLAGTALDPVQRSLVEEMVTAGRGITTLVDHLLANEGSGEPEGDGPAAADGDPVQARVLVVDDDEDVALVVVAMLRRLGCAVERVGSGDDAIEHVEPGRYDVVFMDLGMAGHDGVDTTRHILRRAPGQRVVALTADVTSAGRDRALGAGMVDYLTKPVTLGRLARAIRRA